MYTFYPYICIYDRRCILRTLIIILPIHHFISLILVYLLNLHKKSGNNHTHSYGDAYRDNREPLNTNVDTALLSRAPCLTLEGEPSASLLMSKSKTRPKPSFSNTTFASNNTQTNPRTHPSSLPTVCYSSYMRRNYLIRNRGMHCVSRMNNCSTGTKG